MLGKAIRKAVLPILLASLMVGTGCRIVYGKADISLNERAENHTSDNTAANISMTYPRKKVEFTNFLPHLPGSAARLCWLRGGRIRWFLLWR